ncbi:hypothetical protein [Streptomyces sp. NBC_01233]|uniref:hypothetical protein n=1 Tax=Streptomyces sp. NBC_01233 TaxID=2903787 RepID=UPI002E1150D4|nr:hypothetical protein OG332_03760 [Streptomyces sp. NBC_01233]
MITVVSFEAFAERAPFDPGTAVLGPVSHRSGPLDHSGIAGTFGRLGDTLAVLYRAGGTLRLLLGAEDIAVTEGLGARHERGETLNRLTVGTRHIDYPRPADELDEDDLTALAEPEDFDLGLFLANVLSDPARCDRVYRSSAEAPGTAG